VEVQEQFSDDITIIGVPSLAGADDYPEFISSTGTDVIAHIPDEAGVIWERFGITQQRTYVYIEDDGITEISGYGSLADDVAALVAN